MASTKQKASILFVFDYDNTLFPTWVRQLILQQQRPFTRAEFAELCTLSQWVYAVLHAYISRYSARNIKIVTAAKQGWIGSSLMRLGGIGCWSAIRTLLFDAVHPIELVFPHISILPFKSAPEVATYKYNAFRSLVHACSPDMLVSIGDSSAEYEASKKCAEGVEGMSLGRVKLKRHPSLLCMIRQCQFMLDRCQKLEIKNFCLALDV